MTEQPIPKFKPGDIVDTPYDGRRQILQVWWYEDKFSNVCCWMYEIEPRDLGKEDSSPKLSPPSSSRFEYGLSYSEGSVNQGLFITPLSGLDLNQYKPTHPPTYQDSPIYKGEVEL